MAIYKIIVWIVFYGIITLKCVEHDSLEINVTYLLEYNQPEFIFESSHLINAIFTSSLLSQFITLQSSQVEVLNKSLVVIF